MLTKRKQNLSLLLCVLPALLVYCVFKLYPAISGVYYAMTDWNGISPTYQFIGLQNYLSAFQDKLTMAAVGRTFWYTIVMTLLVTALATLLAATAVEPQWATVPAPCRQPARQAPQWLR